MLRFMKIEYGAAMWAQGTEGAYLQDGKSVTCLEKYAELYPNRMQENYPPFETLDLYNNNDGFIDKLNELELDSIRTSISWSRLFPDGKNINPKAVKFYNSFFSKIRETNTKIWITLYWFDMPVFQEDKGGFTDESVRIDFVNYCLKAMELFDEYVDIFYIYNEPQVDLQFKYLLNHSYPFEVDIQKAYQSQVYMLECQAEVIKKAKLLDLTAKIGTVINVSKVYPRSSHPNDLKAAENAELLDYLPWLSTSVNGVYPEKIIELLKSKGIMISITDEQRNLFFENRIENLGINYYFPQRVKSFDLQLSSEAVILPTHFYEMYKMPGMKINKDRGWEIYPQGLYDVLVDIRDNYQNIETNITENGIGVQGEVVEKSKIVDDQYRIDFTQDSIRECHRALEHGVNLKGFHIWSLVDLWSPTNQFLNKYGLIHFDNSNFSYSLKKSGMWYRDYIKKERILGEKDEQ